MLIKWPLVLILKTLKISNTKRDSRVYLDDCFEIVLNPDYSRTQYYKFIINAGGYLYDKFGTSSKRNFKCEYKAKIFKDRGYWALEFSVDGKDIGNNKIKSGEIWNFMITHARNGPASEYNPFWYDYIVDLFAFMKFL